MSLVKRSKGAGGKTDARSVLSPAPLSFAPLQQFAGMQEILQLFSAVVRKQTRIDTTTERFEPGSTGGSDRPAPGHDLASGGWAPGPAAIPCALAGQGAGSSSA